ncbi:putative Phthiocerol synthesis polyketide synthase type I PpsA [Seiridium unicorne]|uniref:Phthiocerol synthesis polyketide synthase type I PpsA n=1 Tax=Seiridium unicorne TaxID=138068 RepID=A0ABR2URJ1_9PEZI
MADPDRENTSKPHDPSPADDLPNGAHTDYPPHSVAVVGMAGRFPEADSVDELWELLLEGKSTVKRANEERLRLSQGGNSNNTIWWGNWLRDPEAFDHRFFKKSSREAVVWDPQQRILLEVVYEALESASYLGLSSAAEPNKNDYGKYHNLNTVGFLSPTGQCKPFDASANGYCRAEGVAVVVLKELSAAIQDNDYIMGVIVGSATNQNHGVSHITLSNSDSLIDLYKKVLRLSNEKPESITYVEAHGTGTTVGDPIEVRGIREAYGGPKRSFILHFVSIKVSGSTVVALIRKLAKATARVSGLIKVLLMMRHGKIPKPASYSELNPKIPPLSPDKIAIPTTILPGNAPSHLACVNSHRAAGSNSAILVRERPHLDTAAASPSLKSYPLILTTGSVNSLSSYAAKLLKRLRQAKVESTGRLASLTFALADRANHAVPYVFATSVTNVLDLEFQLEGASSSSDITTVIDSKPVVLSEQSYDNRHFQINRASGTTSLVQLDPRQETQGHTSLSLQVRRAYAALSLNYFQAAKLEASYITPRNLL